MSSCYSDELAVETDDIRDENDPLRSIIITPMSPPSAARFWYGDQPSTTVSMATILNQTELTSNDFGFDHKLGTEPASTQVYCSRMVMDDDELVDTKEWNRWTKETSTENKEQLLFNEDPLASPSTVSVSTLPTESGINNSNRRPTGRSDIFHQSYEQQYVIGYQAKTGIKQEIDDWSEDEQADDELHLLTNKSSIKQEIDHCSEAHIRKLQCKCPLSDTPIATRGTLTLTDEKPHACKLCNRHFARLSNLERHMMIHSDEKPYICQLCDRRFAQSSYLKSHMAVHTGEKPYACTLCNMRFTHSSGLRTHTRTHTGEKPYTCKLCNMSFTRSSFLRAHMRIHTGETPYACKICNRGFGQSSHLNTHMRTHNGEKPYACNLCNKRFAHSNTLKEHSTIHSGEKPYRCSLCKKRFARSYCMRRHMKNIHWDEKPRTISQRSTETDSQQCHEFHQPHDKIVECDVSASNTEIDDDRNIESDVKHLRSSFTSSF